MVILQKENTEGKFFLDYLSFLIYSSSHQVQKKSHVLKFNKIITHQLLHNSIEHF